MHIVYYRDYGDYHIKEMIHRNIENGKNFEINVLEAEQTEKFTLGFAFNIYPLADEFVAINNAEDDEDPLDDGPYHQAESELNAFDIRALFKIVRIDMYRPSFTKRHVINLGSADPSALFWNHTKTLLGYSPLLKIDARRGGTNADVPQGFSEYQVTIPVKLENLFKHKLWNLKMHIYQFDEDDLPAENNHNQSFDDDDTCPICLEPLTTSENRPILKLHGKRSNNSNYEHIYHSDCITTWIVEIEVL
uniref:RING-type domain-containing protein n=1 Tax=Globodera pallida TaxID=36090 RepID=A0A183BVN4_GLOPA